jgi:lipoprotein-releasing system permease protein
LRPPSAPFPLLLALRYLQSSRKDAFVSFLSAVAAGGIGLGVAALVLALSALTGMQRALADEILERTPQLEVSLPASIEPAEAERRLMEFPEVRSVQRAAAGRGWLVAEQRALPVALLGFEGELPASFPGAEGRRPGLYLPADLAQRFGLRAGDVVRLASPRPTLTPLGPQPRTLSLAIAGVYTSGHADEETTLALPLERAEILLGSGGTRKLWVSAGGLEEALALAPRLAAGLPAGATVRTWRDLNAGLFFALRLEKSLTFVAVSLIVLVAAFVLISDLALVAVHKRQELAMLAALGASRRQLAQAFLGLGSMLGGAGALAGGGLGVAVAWALGRYHLLHLPAEVYFLDYVPFATRPADLALVLVLALGLATAASGWAASRAVRAPLLELLRR